MGKLLKYLYNVGPVRGYLVDVIGGSIDVCVPGDVLVLVVAIESVVPHVLVVL